MSSFFTTHSAQETRNIAHLFAKTLLNGDIVVLEGELGSGKTTFVQGLLETLGAEGPYTSPTFVICKSYTVTNEKRKTEKIPLISNSPLPVFHPPLSVIHHIDTYRIESKDLLDLGWDDMVNNPNAITFLEWPERVRNILPSSIKTVRFFHKKENEREIQWDSL